MIEVRLIFTFTAEHLSYGGALTIRTKKAIHTYNFDKIWQRSTTMDMRLFIWILVFLAIPLNGRGKFPYNNHSKCHENQHTIPLKVHCFTQRVVESKYK